MPYQHVLQNSSGDLNLMTLFLKTVIIIIIIKKHHAVGYTGFLLKFEYVLSVVICSSRLPRELKF